MARKGIKGITIELGADTVGLDKALRDVNQKSRDLQGELRQVERLLKFDPGNTTLLAQKQEILAEQVENTTEKLNRLKKAQDQVEQQFRSGEIGAEQYRAFQREIAQTENRLDKFKQELKSIDDGKSIENVRQDMSRLGKETDEAKQSVKNLGSEIAGIAAGVGVGMGLAEAVEQALDFSSLDTKIEISMEVPEESKAAVREAIRSVQVYGVDAQEALEGVRRQWALNSDASDEANQKIIKGAGAIAAAYDGIDFIELVQEINEIASELEISNEEALGLTNSLLKIGFPPEELDIIAEYGQQLQRAGYDAEEIQGIMAAGVDTGSWNIDNLLDGLKEGRIRLAEFAEEIPESMGDLLEKTDISEQQMKKWAKQVATGGEEGSKAMQEVAQALEGVEDQTIKNLLGVEIFGTMYEDQGDNISETLLNMNDHMKSAKENQDSLNESIEKLDSDPAIQLQEAMMSLKQSLAPVLEVVAELIGKFAEWVKNNPELTATITAIATALGILTGIFMALSPIITAISTLAGTLGISLGALAGPIGIVIAIIGALIAIGVALYQNWDTIKEYASIIWTAIKDFFSEIWEQIKNVFESALNWIDQQTGGKFSEMVSKIGTFMKSAWNVIKTVWNLIKGNFQATLSFLKSLVTGDFEGMKNAIQTRMQNSRQIISTIWNAIKSVFSTVLSSIVSAVKSKFQEFVNGVRDKMNEAKTNIETIWNNVVSFFEGIDLAQIGRDIIQGLINGITSMASNLGGAIRGVVDNGIKAAKDKLGIKSPSKVFFEIGEFTGEGFVLGIESMLKEVKAASNLMVSASVPKIPRRTLSQSQGKESSLNVNIAPANVILDKQTVGTIVFEVVNEIDRRNQLRSLRFGGEPL